MPGDIRMTEQQIQTKIIKHLEAIGAYVVKVQQATRAGVPDILCCYRGMFIAFEVKRPLCKPTALQELNISAIHSAGGVAIVAHSVDEVKKALTDLPNTQT